MELALPSEPLSAHSPVAVGGRASERQRELVEGDDRTAANKDASQVAVGYLYYLSKRTSVYTAYGRIRDEHGALYTVGNATDAGAGTRSFNLGMAHDF